MLNNVLLIISLALILFTTIRVVFERNLMVITILLGVFSMACVAFYTILGALDVALTEAAVGVGISTVLFLLTIFITKGFNVSLPDSINHQKSIYTYFLLVLTIAIIVFCSGLLIYAPPFGSISSPSINNVYTAYIIDSYRIYHIPNIVTVILGSYRGFDTLGETFVIFIAAISVFAILQQTSKSNKDKSEK
ncbi:hydrogen gas-evolving membrane-bound hydrogenase subunit E [Rickettsiales bacterium LUAb2]